MGHTLRFLLLISSMAALATLFVWIRFPHYVEKLDRGIIDRYVAPYQKRLGQARELLLQKEERRGSDLLESLLADLENVQNGDRLAIVRREAMSTLAESYQRQSRFGDLLDLGERWRQFDPKDLNAEVWLGLSLLALPNRKQEGVRHLSALYEKAPASGVVANAYGEFLFEGGRNLEFFLNFKNQFQAIRERAAGNWEIFWDTGHGFNGRQKRSVRAVFGQGFDMEIRVTLPRGSFRQLRIDCPAWKEICLLEPGFLLPGGSAPQLLSFVDTTHGLHDMTRKEKTFFASGSDPFAEVRLPENLVRDSPWELVFQAKLLPGSIDQITALLRDPEKRETLHAQLEGKGDRLALALYRDLLLLLGFAS